ncbi:MAG: hypothetical protein ACPLKX_09215 [Dictyoglomaceae bacterium]
MDEDRREGVREMVNSINKDGGEKKESNFCKIFTHFYRKEDPGSESEKLDEELKRLSIIVNNIQPNSLLLNETFSSTNEQEDSEIAIEVINALIENNIEVFYVTHLYYNNNLENVIFLRAERKEDGKRTFKILEGQPLLTGYAKDLYRSIFEDYVYHKRGFKK